MPTTHDLRSSTLADGSCGTANMLNQEQPEVVEAINVRAAKRATLVIISIHHLR